MNKKTIILSVLSGILWMAVSFSCTNLDEEIYDQLAGDFPETEKQLNAVIGDVYNSLRTYWPGNYLYLSECAGSMAVTPTRLGGDWYDGGQYRELFMHTWTAQTSQVKTGWSNASNSIGKCNATLYIIEQTDVVSDDVKKILTAEVRGVRAFWYYTMLDYFGNVPLVTEYVPAGKTLPTNSSRQVVFDWLVEEVKEIAPSCPDASAYARFTKGAAYTLLAKLLLNAEAWGVTYGGDAYKEASDYCDLVLGMDYILEPVWKDNFSLTNHNSREAIFAVAFSKTDTENQNQMMNRTLHYKDQLSLGGNFSAWNGICAQPEYVELFDVEDPRYAGSFLIGKQYDRATGKVIITDHGLELNHTVAVTMLPNTEYDGTPWGAVNQHDGARCLKWPYAQDLVNAMENDFHIFRLADVYLMKAEAVLRSGGGGADAAKWVDDVRARAYGNRDHDYKTVDLAKILLERRLELAWEGSSRQDDIRFGEFGKTMWKASNCERATGEHLKLYPISQDAWQTNPNLVQNQGYPKFQ
ncbi:MAG TPA: RagB/SusD family nutrient uptake outer membrane protein [Porphyromonadaceae bacterium]|jgi:hypothetical protein|nr:RagB/SusD family nutrient uptake outer membrane protein [Porphyromonadaceae bacterium]HBK30340.1 RagB/SusD family nutrient uptake outer membrane protein [Porphyromonadaceae bacterium]HBL34036.1 RagB/SusD family nutrient uptake outer membrane protein [Porphyromonadaceae bacterium]HBX21883.1 RagB/SusD family nutrient uptake outer membrane protein [Porphyromonadaceae bacterium]